MHQLVEYAPLAIVVLLVSVWLVEHFLRGHLDPKIAAGVGVPLPSATRRLSVVAPELIPDHWLTGFVPLGNQTWLLQDDAKNWCFAVLTARRDEGELTLTMKRRLPFAMPASVAGIAAMTQHGSDQDRGMLLAGGYTLIWSLMVLRGYLELGKTLHAVADRIRIFAAELPVEAGAGPALRP